MIMKAKMFSTYIDALLEADLPNLNTIRIGTKALSYWPYKFLTDDDADQLLDIFEPKKVLSNSSSTINCIILDVRFIEVLEE
ncbi:hypothetical protein LCGC14_1013760, partial [marine sediment metagenome]